MRLPRMPQATSRRRRNGSTASQPALAEASCKNVTGSEEREWESSWQGPGRCFPRNQQTGNRPGNRPGDRPGDRATGQRTCLQQGRRRQPPARSSARGFHCVRAKEKGCIGDAALYMSSSEGGNPMPTTRIIARSPHATRIPICRTAPALAGACTWQAAGLTAASALKIQALRTYYLNELDQRSTCCAAGTSAPSFMGTYSSRRHAAKATAATTTDITIMLLTFMVFSPTVFGNRTYPGSGV